MSFIALIFGLSVYASAETWSDKDLDGDDLSDEWELHYFGNIRDYSGRDDSDGDGVTNRDEFVAGTDPTRPPN